MVLACSGALAAGAKVGRAVGGAAKRPQRCCACCATAASSWCPRFFDIVSTGTHKVGLMWLQVSVYQMLRASQLLFTVLYSVAFLRRTLDRWQLSGIAATVAGIGLVGLAGILGHEEAAPAEVPLKRMLAGMGLVVGSEAIHAAQLVTEDQYIADLSLRPLTVVGLEGALGSCIVLGAVLPLAQRLPGPAGRGLHEDSRETLRMLAASRELRLAAAAYVCVGGLFNLAGMLMTDSVGAVFRTILELLRTLSVWVINLTIFYTLDGSGDRRFGEPWTSASWLQALGFLCMVAGALLYAHGKAEQEREQQAAAAAAGSAAPGDGDSGRLDGARPLSACARKMCNVRSPVVPRVSGVQL
ncbi:hypothetical protein ABPG75_005644 [Micractinium tetrahymenae]